MRIFVSILFVVTSLVLQGRIGADTQVCCTANRKHLKRNVDYNEWTKLLECYIQHTQTDRQYIQRVVLKGVSVETRKLSQLLIDEWDSKEMDSQPEVVNRLDSENMILQEDTLVKSWVFVQGTVCVDGFVESPRVIVSSGNKAVDQACTDRLMSSQYRPALSGGQFIKASITMSCRPAFHE